METKSCIQIGTSGNEALACDGSADDSCPLSVSDCDSWTITDSVVLAREKYSYWTLCTSSDHSSLADDGYMECDNFDEDMFSDDEYDLPLNDAFESSRTLLETTTMREEKRTSRPPPTRCNDRGDSSDETSTQQEDFHGFKPRKSSLNTFALTCGSVPTAISLPTATMRNISIRHYHSIMKE